MDHICRLCGIKSDQLVSNDELVDRVFEFFHFKATSYSNPKLHKRFCQLCEDKLKLIADFYQSIIDTESKLNSMLNEKDDDVKLNETGQIDVIDKVQEKIYKLPNLKITKIKSLNPEYMAVEDKRKTEISELIDRLSTKKSVTISKVSANKSQTDAEYCNLEVLEDVSIVDTDEYVDLTDVNEMLSSSDTNMDSSIDDEKTIENEETEKSPVTTPTPVKLVPNKKPKSAAIKRTARSKNVTVVKMDTPAAYVCMTCKEQFITFELLKHHMTSNQKCKTFHLTCNVCKKVCDNKKSLYQHSLTHRSKYTFVCDECGKAYSNRFNLENHKSSFHGEQVEEFGSIYKCKVCEKQFTNRKNLHEHISTHVKVLSVHLCDTCGKCFNSFDTLKSHQRVHLDYRPFPCDQCERRFRSRLQLTQHLHVHTGIKEYTCDVCGKAFAKRGSLASHARVHSGEAPFECDICNERFTSLNRLKAHTKQHYTLTQSHATDTANCSIDK